ncbi:MAG: hypothetical protein ACYC5M_13805 [Anaerolineae bacterium]
MKRMRLPVSLILVMLATIICFPASVQANLNNPLVIDTVVLGTSGIDDTQSPYALVVQATSVAGDPYRYIVTVTNLSPWTISSFRLLDRYFLPDTDQAEVVNEWQVMLKPDQAASTVLSFANGTLASGCHQLELHLADGLDTILMDCEAPNATTLWNVPLTEEMASYLPEPTVEEEVEVIDLREPRPGSKLGLHVTSNNSPAIMAFIREAQPALVVSVGDMGFLAEVKKASPDTITIARWMDEDQEMWGDPVARAREFVESHAERYLDSPQVDYWLGWNEPVIDSVDDARWYAAFETERTIAMAELDLKVAVGNFGVGIPEPEEFEAFLPAIAAARAHDGVLSLHEYSAPTMRDGVGAGLPGVAALESGGALTLRFRFWYEHYLKPHNLLIPLVITEAGVDGGVLRAGQGGWRDFADTNADGSPTAQAIQDYLEQLAWYDTELQNDLTVLGFAVFNSGGLGGNWRSFDVTGILPELTERVRDSR